MKKIIVTGCNGQLGRAINQVYADSREYECVNTDVAQLDITNIEAVMKLAEEVKPYAIINCAAHTNVNACETDVDNAYKINAIGPRNLSIAATRYNAKLVHIQRIMYSAEIPKSHILNLTRQVPRECMVRASWQERTL